MSKRFYFEIAAILVVSLLLLGFSFSRESGTNIKFSKIEAKYDDLKIVYGNGRYITMSNSVHYYNIVNTGKEEKTYYIYISEINNAKDYKISYEIDDEVKEVVDGYITSITLKPYGTDGDRIGLKIKYIIEDPELEFKLLFEEHKPYVFIDDLKKNESVYEDKEGNVRFFGKDVNNYVRFDGSTYRMIGYVDGKLLLLGEERILTRYEPNSSADYVSVKDYLGSLEEHDLDIESAKGKTSWIVDDHDYWLKDKESDYVVYYADKVNGLGTLPTSKFLYNRFVTSVEGRFKINSGDGTRNNPYEVSYES